MNCLSVTVTRREYDHPWIAVIFEKDGTECGWICRGCGMCAQSEPTEVNLHEKERKTEWQNLKW